MNKIPLNAFAPYKAEEAPGSNSTLATSIQKDQLSFLKQSLALVKNYPFRLPIA
jgi:hypothetical protein